MKNMNWKKILTGLALVISGALSMYHTGSFGASDIAKLQSGAELISEGASETAPVEPAK